MVKESLLPSHIGVYPCGGRVGVTEHILNELRVKSLLNHQAAAGVTQGVGGYLRVINPNGSQPVLDNQADSPTVEPVASALAQMVDEEGIVNVPFSSRSKVVLQKVNDLLWYDDILVLVAAPLALQMEDRSLVYLVEVADVYTVDFAGSQPVAQHQGYHQFVPLAGEGLGVDTIQKPATLLGGERELVILRQSDAAPDTDSDVVVVFPVLAPRVEYLDNGDITVDREDALILVFEVILEVDDIRAARLSWVFAVATEPSEPEVYLAPVISLGSRKAVRLAYPLVYYFI